MGTFLILIVVLGALAGAFYVYRRRAPSATSLIRHELGRFTPTSRVQDLPFKELKNLVTKLDLPTLKSRRVSFVFYDNDRVVVGHLLDVDVFTRCALIEYLDLTRLIGRILSHA